MRSGARTTRGKFRLGDRRYCYPLTITDVASCDLLTCETLSTSDVEPLRSALVRLAEEGTLTRQIVSAHGTKFVVDGVLRSPSGSEAIVRTVWIVDTGGGTPRLVTAYPGEGK
jgi:hypothetical protein